MFDSTDKIKTSHCIHSCNPKLTALSKQAKKCKAGSCLYSRSHHNHQCDKPTIKKPLSVVYASCTTRESLHSMSNSVWVMPLWSQPISPRTGLKLALSTDTDSYLQPLQNRVLTQTCRPAITGGIWFSKHSHYTHSCIECSVQYLSLHLS